MGAVLRNGAGWGCVELGWVGGNVLVERLQDPCFVRAAVCGLQSSARFLASRSLME
jgi:hypothetical protein